MSPKRGTISVSKALYDRLHAFTEARGISMAGLVEELLEPVLRGVDPAATAAPALLPAPQELDRAMLDRMAADRRALGLMAASMPVVRVARDVALDIPAHVSTALFDQLSRARAAGREVEPGQLLESAINRMLDALTRLPWCRACLEAIEDCRCRRKQPKKGTP